MPDSPLLDALKRAADDPAARPEFYQRLLLAEVLVIGENGDAADSLSIESWQNSNGEQAVPFFTDQEALRRAVDEDKPTLTLTGRALFEITAGARLVLNPGSEYGKEFFPAEVRSLLENGTNHSPETRRAGAGEEVLLGQPSEYPTAMVEALQRLLTGYPEVEAAYLCLMKQGGDNPQQSLVVGLRGADLERARTAAGAVIADTAPEGRAVDLVEISGDRNEGGLAGYLSNETTAFYERQRPAAEAPEEAPKRPWWRRLMGG